MIGTQMRRSVFTIFLLAAPIIAFAAASNAETSSDLRVEKCEFVKRQIRVTCSVVVDELRVKEIVLNRGRCRSPVPTDEDKQMAEQFIPGLASQSLPANVLAAVNSQGLLMAMQGDPKALAAVRVVNDPTAPKTFGDDLTILVECPNLLEMTLRYTDGKAETFTFR